MAAEEVLESSKPKAEEKPEPKPEPKAEAKEAKEEPAPVSAAPASAGPVVLIEDSTKRKKKKKAVEIAIRITRVTKRFGPKVAVDDVSLKIKAGSVYGLIGPNGAGKTTTFSMLAGFLKPTEGAIEILGYEPDAVDELRSRIGVLPQDALLPSTDRVGEFLMHMARLQDVPSDQVANAARDVLAEVDGKDWWNVRCNALSHGMAKRVQLAQALLGDPEVVLLDEPTSGLDPRVAYEVRQLIKTRRGRCTLIVSSHNLQELEEVCDAAAILDRGKVVAHGTMTELTAASEEIRIKVAARYEGNVLRKGLQTVPMDPIRAIPHVTRVELDDERSEVIVYFERKGVDAETIIGQTLSILLQNNVRISGVSKGRGLEQRVMELT
jgi:ABC-type multidrug transport system ATPase subunit